MLQKHDRHPTTSLRVRINPTLCVRTKKKSLIQMQNKLLHQRLFCFFIWPEAWYYELYENCWHLYPATEINNNIPIVCKSFSTRSSSMNINNTDFKNIIQKSGTMTRCCRVPETPVIQAVPWFFDEDWCPHSAFQTHTIASCQGCRFYHVGRPCSTTTPPSS